LRNGEIHDFGETKNILTKKNNREILIGL